MRWPRAQDRIGDLYPRHVLRGDYIRRVFFSLFLFSLGFFSMVIISLDLETFMFSL